MSILPDISSKYAYYQKDNIKKIISSLVVAVTGKSDIEIIITSGDTRAVADKLYLSELKSFTQADINLWRGYIDRALFKIAYHDIVCEQKYSPIGSSASLLFSYIMRLRYEIKGVDNFYGSVINLKAVYNNNQIDWDSNEGRGLYYAILYLLPDLIDNKECFDIHSHSKIVPYLRYLQLSLDDDINTFANAAVEFAVFICQDYNASDTINSNALSVDEYYS